MLSLLPPGPLRSRDAKAVGFIDMRSLLPPGPVHVVNCELFQLNLPQSNHLLRNVATSASNNVSCAMETTSSTE
ncbi:hypothetical protein A2U01_0055704, partial [Trifolium medium]|nr:hypothetical protein [Trifolium medium]